MEKVSAYIFLFLSFIHINVEASHLVGGEIYYESLGNDNYRVTLKVYRDCNSRNAGGQLSPFDQPAIVGIYDEFGGFIRTENFRYTPPANQLPVIVDNPCLTAPPNICVDEAVYERTIVLPKSSSDYILTYQRCCRNQSIINIDGPAPFFSGTHGNTYTTTIPGTNKLPTGANSSPVFRNFPPLVICTGDNIRFDHSARDPDGDSLVYSLCDPFTGLSTGMPQANNLNPPSPPPYTAVPWKAGYSATNPIDASPAFAIDSRTGRLTGTPTAQGQYVVGVCVQEYRNGVLLSETKRDFQFNATFCNSQPVAAASTQEAFCNGLTVTFKNQSTNARYFFWDFGDINSTDDTSNLEEPTYTFPDTGKYRIMLIVNPGWSCADTTYTIYEVFDVLKPSFDPPQGQCFDNHSFDLEAGGQFQSYANFEWDFGRFGNPNKSFEKSPRNTQFSNPGDQIVKLTVRENGCTEEYIDTLKTYPNPEIGFSLPESRGCVPFLAEFVDESYGWTKLSYLWNFGDDSTSTEANPKHLYPKEGRYDVSLTVSTSEVCIDTLYFKWDRLVHVYPRPTAGLLIGNRNISSFEPTVTFEDKSVGSVRCLLDLGDGNLSNLCDYTHTYSDTGTYEIQQVVYEEHGCTDTLNDILRVKPELLFFAPNAFTPTGDNINDVYRPSVFGAKSYEFIILNRWGEIVFQTNYINSGWNGKMRNGKPAPVDNYIYRANIKDDSEKTHHYSGMFTLIR